MIGILLGWTFAALLYFKVSFDAAFYYNISIVAALLLAIVFGLLIFAASGIYAQRLLPFNWSPGKVPATVGQLIGRTIGPFMALVIAYGVVARLIIFGFSKQLSGSLEMMNYRGNINTEFVLFCLIISAPITLHYAMCIFGTYRNANSKTISH